MSEQLPSESKLDELKRLCEPMSGEPMRMVSRLELLALVECAEELRVAAADCDTNGLPLTARAAISVLAKLEAL